ncbi:MAG: protein kinase domain-containing protein [Actinomycetota bacterium]
MTSTGLVAEPETIPSWGGRYEVLSLLGRGGTAEVFEATDRLLGRRVAVKVLREGMAPGPQAVSSFRREARAAASLNHPSIVTVHDVGMDEDRPFIVMELVNGEPLSDVLDRDGRLAPERAAAIAQAMAEALACAHDAGIVHRDLKPRNVMLTAQGQVKVLDFGIAQALDRTPVDEPLGTAEYLSPEQATGLPLDGRSDIYSLGVVLFEMLAGRPPFTGDLALAVMHQHVTEEPPPLARFSPEAPAPLCAIVDRCLRKDPGARPRSARELAFELRRFRPGPDATDPLPPMRRTDPLDAVVPEGAVPSGRRRRGMIIGAWVLAGLALVLASIGLVLSVGGWTKPVTPTRPQVLRPPVRLVAQGTCDGFFRAKASLAWRPTGSRIADGYVVYRSESPVGPYVQIGTLPGTGVAAYVDQALGLNATYYYRLRTTSGARLSAFSEPARAETPFFCL